jgi:hypothetical protein
VSNNFDIKAALAEWLAGQSQYKNIREAADGIGMPFNTLRGYFYGKHPSDKNLELLVKVIGLDLRIPPKRAKPSGRDSKRKAFANQTLSEMQYDLARCIVNIPAIQATLSDGMPEVKQLTLSRVGRNVQTLMDALERCLDPILNEPEALVLLRKTVSGSDAGYLSGLLGALFDDRRLSTWREMTTYKYGSR